MDQEQTYEEWEDEMLTMWKGPRTSWIAVDHWLYPGKVNQSFHLSDNVYHVCRGNYDRLFAASGGYDHSVAKMEGGCLMCGAEVPEGIKMIILLAKL
jgi:hypothetical protein